MGRVKGKKFSDVSDEERNRNRWARRKETITKYALKRSEETQLID